MEGSVGPVRAFGGHRPPQRRWRRGVEIGVVAIAVVVGVVVWRTAIGAVRDAAANSVPLTTGPERPVEGGVYALLLVDPDGDAAAWDACTPIRYVVNTDLAPYDGALGDVREAFSRLSAASGLEFVFAGVTDEVPSDDRPARQPDRYGDDGWAPILVAWSHPDRSPELADENIGGARPVVRSLRDRHVIVSGQITLDATFRATPGFGLRRSWGSILLHEVGHLAGLDHVASAGEIMDGDLARHAHGAVDWGPGDRAGLRELASRPCGAVPRPAG